LLGVKKDIELMKKLAVITTHPIQYNAPIFKMLQLRANIEVKVFYTWSQSAAGNTYDPGFKKNISWDIPLLDGYAYTFIENVAAEPGTHHFGGINNPSLIKEIEAWNPDALLVYSWSFKSHLKVLRTFHGRIPILFRGDSTLLDEKSGLKRFARNIVLKWVYNKIDIGLYVGEHNKQYYLLNGKSDKDLVRIPHAIDNKRFSANISQYKSEAYEWRQKLGIGKGDLVFLFAGKLEPKKNPSLLIEAFTELAVPNVHLVMVGNGVEEEKLKKKFIGLENLHFIDFQNQSKMPVVYHLGDVFVLPSKGPEETWGLALNEAMACEKPVLASTKCGGAIDLVESGKNGYIFKSEDKEDLKEKMMKFIIHKDQLAAMGRFSSSVVQNYSFERICEGIENILYKFK
jgi:glycosyltransferase involved in cell wall biosynthesis